MLDNQDMDIIVIMLDLQKTLDGINDKTATIFMNQVEFLRNKFKANKALIYISSQTEDVSDLYESTNVLKRNLNLNIFIDDCYYYNGIYNPITGKEEKIYSINDNKLLLFQQKYLENIKKPKFFAIIDDSVLPEQGLDYQETCPMVFVRPSQYDETSFKEDNFVCYSSLKRGFDGVIEALNTYLEKIKLLLPEEIFEIQRSELFTISGSVGRNWLLQKKYNKLLLYLKSNKILKKDHYMLAHIVKFQLFQEGVSEEEIKALQEIAQIIYDNLNDCQKRILERCL